MKNLCRMVLALYLLSVTSVLWAVPIEGTTPSGKFKAVFVTEEGRLPVSITTTTLQHVVVDGGTVAVTQAGVFNVNAAQDGVWTVGMTVVPSTASLLNNNCIPIPAAAATLVLSASTVRRGSLICNQDFYINTWIGGNLGVDDTNAPVTPPGACLNPDEGSNIIYQGALYAYTTAPLTLCYYEKR